MTFSDQTVRRGATRRSSAERKLKRRNGATAKELGAGSGERGAGQDARCRMQDDGEMDNQKTRRPEDLQTSRPEDMKTYRFNV